MADPGAADRSLLREADAALKERERSANREAEALRDKMRDELVSALESPGRFEREAPVEQESEESYTARLRAALRADFLRHAGGE